MSLPSRSAGNVFVYVLIAVVLFAGLSFALSRSNDSAPQNEISAAQTQAAVSDIFGYAAQAQSAIDQMVMNGTSVDQIDFIMPNETNFNTSPTLNKLFHPDGGGLQYKSLPSKATGNLASPSSAYYIGRFNNWEWTPTSQFDVIFTAYGINEPVCMALNRKITASATYPTIGNIFRTKLVAQSIGGGGSNSAMTASDCPACKEKISYCVKNTGGAYAFYTILVAR